MFPFFQSFAFDQDVGVASIPFLRRNGSVVDDFATCFREEDCHWDGDGTGQAQQEPKDRMPSSILRKEAADDGSLAS